MQRYDELLTFDKFFSIFSLFMSFNRIEEIFFQTKVVKIGSKIVGLIFSSLR